MSDLGAYKKLSEETRRFDKPLSQRVIWQLADALDSVVARLERLEAQRDEALALHQEWTSGEGLTVCAHCASLAPDPPPGSIFSDTAWPCATVRVLSRTEDGTKPRSYYDVVRSMTADPDVLAAVDKAEAEDGTNDN